MEPGTWVMMGVLVVALANMLPVAYELILSALQYVGLRPEKSKRLVQVNRYMDRFGNFAEKGLVAMTLGFIGGAIMAHVVVYYPFFRNQDPSWTHWILFHGGPSIWLNVNMFYNHWMATFTPSGTPSYDAVRGRFGEVRKLCAHCEKPKPPRTHHCGTCNRCVERLDHHCPFVANCVGQDNYAYFFLFIMYTWLSTVYAVLLCLKPFVTCAHAPSDEVLPDVCLGITVNYRVIFWISVVSCVTLGGLFALMLFHVSSGLTMNEFLCVYVWRSVPTTEYNHWRSKSRLRNMEAVMGSWRIWWRYLLPSRLDVSSFPLTLAEGTN